jgi:hypothetical protein
MKNNKQLVCFVIMGFGKKIDYTTGKTINLDSVYKKVIRPAAEKAGCRVIRADEIMESGLIDVSMFALIYRADIVIADITTLNPNAMYELGVRHSLKKRPTIIVNDENSPIPFDIAHNRNFRVEHDIDKLPTKEVRQSIDTLSYLISKVLDDDVVDSPTYTFMPELIEPLISEEVIEKLIGDLKSREESIYALTTKAQKFKGDSKFSDAIPYWDKLIEKCPGEAFYIQQKALCTYKQAVGKQIKPYTDALNVLSPLKENNEPETCGLRGSINKRLFLLTGDIAYLEEAINNYQNGWHQDDYYTGENLATCYLLKSEASETTKEKDGFKFMAMQIYNNIIPILKEDITTASDKKWPYATMSNSEFAIDELSSATEYEKKFLDCKPEDWEKDTFYETKEIIKSSKLEKLKEEPFNR